jgi:hypothetical protein
MSLDLSPSERAKSALRVDSRLKEGGARSNLIQRSVHDKTAQTMGRPSDTSEPWN